MIYKEKTTNAQNKFLLPVLTDTDGVLFGFPGLLLFLIHLLAPSNVCSIRLAFIDTAMLSSFPTPESPFGPSSSSLLLRMSISGSAERYGSGLIFKERRKKGLNVRYYIHVQKMLMGGGDLDLLGERNEISL